MHAHQIILPIPIAPTVHVTLSIVDYMKTFFLENMFYFHRKIFTNGNAKNGRVYTMSS